MAKYPLTHVWRVGSTYFQRKRGRTRTQDLKAAHERAKVKDGSPQVSPPKQTKRPTP